MLPPFAFLRPTTLHELLEMLSDDYVPYCGGTELLLAMRAGLQRPEALVDIKRVPELGGIRLVSGDLVIGATVTHHDAARHPLVHERIPLFAQVESAVGNARVRAQGSIGGNLCFAEPKSDVTTALVALDATVTLVSAGDQGRTVAVDDFLVGAYEADRRPEDVLVEVRVPLRDGQRGVYVKCQTRERPTIGVAIVTDDHGCRLVVGAVGERPVKWTFDRPEDIRAERIADEVDPVPDLTGSEPYLRHLTAVYVRRAVRDICTGDS